MIGQDVYVLELLQPMCFRQELMILAMNGVMIRHRVYKVLFQPSVMVILILLFLRFSLDRHVVF